MASDGSASQKSELYNRKKSDAEHIPKPEPSQPKKKSSKKSKKKKKKSKTEDDSDESDIDINNIIPDDPLFSGKATEGIGNRPEMTTLLQDDEILAKFQDAKTTEYLRAIANDTSRIEEFENTPELQFLIKKISAEFDRTRKEKEAAAKLAAERAADPTWGPKVAQMVREAREKRAAEAAEAARRGATAGPSTAAS